MEGCFFGSKTLEIKSASEENRMRTRIISLGGYTAFYKCSHYAEFFSAVFKLDENERRIAR